METPFLGGALNRSTYVRAIGGARILVGRWVMGPKDGAPSDDPDGAAPNGEDRAERTPVCTDCMSCVTVHPQDSGGVIEIECLMCGRRMPSVPPQGAP